MKSPVRLVLFFTRNVSLGTWDAVGSLSRELSLYLRLSKRGVRIDFISYGGRSEKKYLAALNGISVHYNRWGLPTRIYSWLIPILHFSILCQATVLKTNQLDGGEVALRSARIFRKSLLARCGYLWSFALEHYHGRNSKQACRARKIEQSVFSNSSAISVTTSAIRRKIVHEYVIPKEKIRIFPNVVDLNVFHPTNMERENFLCYVGRLDQSAKNLRALVEAVLKLDVELVLIGDGPLREELDEISRQNPKIKLLGRIANEDLSEYLCSCAAFVLSSFFEGHPKALLEAMACATPVIATAVPGIRELVEHGKNGWLCEPDAASLAAGIAKVLADTELRKKMSLAARELVQKEFSLEGIVEEELRILTALSSRTFGASA